MSNINRLIAYGSSPIDGTELPGKNKNLAFSAVLAQSLNLAYECRAKPVTSNSKITRKILSSKYQSNDMVLVLWTAPNRYEYKTENGWVGFTALSKATSGLIREWLDGPGQLEYTEIYISLKEIIIAQEFLKKKNIPYIFSIDNDSIHTSYLYNNPDDYIESLKSQIDWDKFYFFEGHGFINWAKNKNYPFTNTHAGVEAHQAAADYILTNWREAFISTNVSMP